MKKTMKKTIKKTMKKIVLTAVMICALMLSGCGGEKMIGPRSEDAWKRWEEHQKELKETWGETEIYAYVQTLRDDFLNVNANVVFKEDFSLETESKELDALRKLYDDVNFSTDIGVGEFLDRLADSQFRYAVGSPLELEGIEEIREGDAARYKIALEYYANVDSLMRVQLEVTTGKNGKFSAETSFPEEERKK